MKKSILCLEGVTILSKSEQKRISGNGGPCAARQWRNYAPPLRGQYYVVAYDLSPEEGLAWANGGAGGGHVACTPKGYADSSWTILG